MAKHQRYVSEELTQFVGSRLDREQQYQLLVLILRDGLLKSPGESDVSVDQTLNGPHTTISYKLTVNHDKPLSSNDKYRASIVCFADIPVEDLPLHIQKYSPFGLSFAKAFLLQYGANPVFYVASQSATNLRNPLMSDSSHYERLKQQHQDRGAHGEWTNLSRGELFDAAEAIQQVVFPTYNVPSFVPGQRQSEREAAPGRASEVQKELQRTFFAWHLFPYMKFFNPQLPEDDPDNYYMEREWRVVGTVRFTTANIRRILLPEAFARRLRVDFPEYYGQITFTE
jgi:hypothetical protein